MILAWDTYHVHVVGIHVTLAGVFSIELFLVTQLTVLSLSVDGQSQSDTLIGQWPVTWALHLSDVDVGACRVRMR